MLKICVEDYEEMDVEKLAVESKIKLYAIDTFRLIKEKYRNDDIFFIMGSDNFKKMPNWKEYGNLINNYNIIVIEREIKKIKNKEKENIIDFVPKKLAEVNSTKIRDMIKNNKNVHKFLKPEVYEYIKKNNLYV